jgi:hypothetical protein
MVQPILDDEVTADLFKRLRQGVAVSSHTHQLPENGQDCHNGATGKPSELMAAIERFKLPLDNLFYMYHFLQRLPWEVRTLSADKDPKDTKEAS